MENKLYKKGKECIGQNLTDGYNELGCAAAVNNVVRLSLGQPINDSPSTIKMYNSLLSDRRFQRITEPELGSIILSPTSGKNIGHTGIISDRISDKNFKIMSNRSSNSLWSEHLTLAEWWYKYRNLPIVFFRYQFPAEPAILPKEPIPELSNIEQQKISILQKIVELYKQIISLKLKNMKFGALSSSQNPEKLSLTIKSIVAGLLPVIHLISGVEILGENADKVIDAVFLLITTGMTIYGYIRAKTA